MDIKFEITDMTREDDGILGFELAPDPDLASRLPPRVIEDIKRDAGNEWVQARFSAVLDCRTLSPSLEGAIVDRDGRELNDYDIRLPENGRRALMSAIDDWCAKNLSHGIVAAADDHLAHCGVKMGIGDWIGRMGNIGFDEKRICAVRACGGDTDYFGNAISLSFSPRLPDLLERLGAELRANGLKGLIEITPPAGVFDIAPIEIGGEEYARLDWSFGRVPAEKMDRLVEDSPEVGRHYCDTFILPRDNPQIVTRFQAKDCDEMISDHLSVSEMRKMTDPAAPKSGAKPGMR